MPSYVSKQLQKYDHQSPSCPQDSPFPAPPTRYGRDAQKPTPIDTSEPCTKAEQKFVQRVTGSFLYYGRAVDATILTSLSSLASQQSNPTKKTLQQTHHFLDYMASHPNAVIRYTKSNMILNIHSDASYMTEPKARSRIAGHYFLASLPKPSQPIPLNGSIHTLCSILKHVAASAAEAELGALFTNARQGKIMRLALEEMGHPQPPTPIHTDNSTAAGISNSTVKRQRSRAMDMRYFWIVDQVDQNNFDVQWHPGQENLADYATKHHSAATHRKIRPFYVHTHHSPTHLTRALTPSQLRGCVKTQSRNPILSLGSNRLGTTAGSMSNT